MADEPRLIKTPHGATFAGPGPDDLAMSLPGALEARDRWTAANRLAHRRATAAEHARAELELLRRERVAVPILLDATRLADHRDRLALNAEAEAFAALRCFDRLVNPPQNGRPLTTQSPGTSAGLPRKEHTK